MTDTAGRLHSRDGVVRSRGLAGTRIGGSCSGDEDGRALLLALRVESAGCRLEEPDALVSLHLAHAFEQVRLGAQREQVHALWVYV